MKRILIILLVLTIQQVVAAPWVSDLGNGNYKNPIIYADYSDPDVVRVGDDFYMTASSFNCVPALPILHSTDLVNWELINYAVKLYPDNYFDIPQHGNGAWAPAIRFHDGWFYIYWGDPDRGIYMVRTQDPYGDWSAPVLVKKAFGNIDCCPLWDDDGNVYLVHAWAHSRAGINSTLQVVKLTDDASENVDKGTIVVDGHANNPTLEGAKFYKRNGYYYIFAPAGGVAGGWQMVFRSKNVYGPYEEKKVLEQGSTNINGPHQGAWIELENGENWFLHFQEVLPYGRIAHLQPVKWVNDWPVMGKDFDSNGIGEPLLEHKKPNVRKKSEIKIPRIKDDFNGDELGLQWQWQANWRKHWWSLSENKGSLRLNAQFIKEIPQTLWMVPNLLLQKLPAPEFTAITKVNVENLKRSERTGLLIMGLDYAALSITNRGDKVDIAWSTCHDAFMGKDEHVKEAVKVDSKTFWLRVVVENGGKCQFAFSQDGEKFQNIGEPFQAREGRWIGAKVGLFTVSTHETGLKGFADYDFFNVE